MKVPIIKNIDITQDNFCSPPSLKFPTQSSVSTISNHLSTHPADNDNKIRVGTWNARSCRNKTCDIEEMVLDGDFDIFIMSETWLAEHGDEALVNEMTPVGYSSKSFPRKERGGGGLAIIFKNHLANKITFDDMSYYKYNCFEAFKCALRYSKHVIRIVSIYRPPNSLNNTFSNFLKEFNYLVTDLGKTSSPLIYVGDFNISCNNPNKTEVDKFLQILKNHDLTQHVKSPTNNISKNIIDLVISSRSSMILGLSVIETDISDHNVISFYTNFTKTRPLNRKVLS